jgi:hypothetical protein
MILFAAFWFVSMLATPLALIVGWTRFKRHPRQTGFCGWAGFFSLMTATVSALLAIGALMHGGWKYYDPLLMKIYGAGLLVSTLGLVLGILGLFRRGDLRWIGAVASFGMLMFWFGAAISE